MDISYNYTIEITIDITTTTTTTTDSNNNNKEQQSVLQEILWSRIVECIIGDFMEQNSRVYYRRFYGVEQCYHKKNFFKYYIR